MFADDGGSIGQQGELDPQCAQVLRLRRAHVAATGQREHLELQWTQNHT